MPSSSQFTARHVTRDLIPDCDFLSKERILSHDHKPTAAFAEFRRLLECRLQFSPEIIILGAPPGSRGRMTLLIRAKDHPGSPPSFESMREAYA